MMSYINYGTSWRHPSNVVGIFRPLTPNLAQFTHLDPEKSKSIEAGLKADYLERRVRAAASVFHKYFKNYQYRVPSVYYVYLYRTGQKVSTFIFTSRLDG